MAVVVVFIDCMCPEDTDEYLSRCKRGRIISGIPRVTPYVICGMMTGKKPPGHGVLCPTRWKNGILHRTRCKTLIEELSEEYRVLNYMMPLTAKQNGKHLLSVGSGVGMVENPPPGLRIAKSGGCFWIDDPDKIQQGYVDNIKQVFATMRALIRRDVADIYFISVRELDSLGHFFYPELRKLLSTAIDIEIDEMGKMGDLPILVFSDHGAREMEHSFLINKWLQARGWLSLDIFEPGLKVAENQRGRTDVPNSLNIQSPLVHVKPESYFLSADAYDSGIVVLRDDAPVEKLKVELIGTGMIKGVYSPIELYGDGKYLDELGCDLVCDRADGVMVSANVHPNIDTWKDPDVPCNSKYRTGVHTRFGMWGTNVVDFGVSQDYHPHEFYHVIKAFCLEYGTPYKEPDEGHDKEADRIRELGYEEAK